MDQYVKYFMGELTLKEFWNIACDNVKLIFQYKKTLCILIFRRIVEFLFLLITKLDLLMKKLWRLRALKILKAISTKPHFIFSFSRTSKIHFEREYQI